MAYIVGGATVVHEGRGGYVQIDERRYVIEHVEGGRFCIHVPSGDRTCARAADLDVLEGLRAHEPDTWSIEIGPA